jgi:dienelactone hydrolase
MMVIRLVKRILKGLAGLLILGVVGIGLLLCLLWFEHKVETPLPTPTGIFAVGRATYTWIDDVRTDRLAPSPGIKREFVVWIWYPSVHRPSESSTEDYLPAPWRAAVERYRGTLISGLLDRDYSRVRTHSLRDAEISPRLPTYPVIIMRAGLAALTTEYTTLAEDLASHGYVVVGFDAPYRTQVVALPGGRVIYRSTQNDPEVFGGREGERIAGNLVMAWTGDAGFVLDELERLNASGPSGRFAGRLDLSRVGIFGHSLGGATAAQFCHDDARCKAGIDIDGAPYGSVIRDGIDKPFMFLMSDHGDASDADSRRIEANIQSIYDKLPSASRLRIVIHGANHYDFSDGAVVKSQIVLRMLRLLGVVGIDGRRQLAVTTYCIHSFFDAYLKHAGGPGIKIESSRYPEITLPPQRR